MYLLYSFVLTLLFVALLPYFAYQATRHGKYAGSFFERLGKLPAGLRSDGRKTIWIHAVSVGELLAARPLIRRLGSELTHARIVVSTTTLTGQLLARSQPELVDSVFYFPFDWKFAVRRSLGHVNPAAVIILETELWPNFLRECKRRNVITMLANGRISTRSFRRYQMIGRPFRRAVEDLTQMIMQSEADAERARRLGAPAARVRVCGNLKYDLRTPDNSMPGPQPCGPAGNLSDSDNSSDQNEAAKGLFARLAASPLIFAGSTAPGEEEILLNAFRIIRRQSGLEDARLVLAPRHPQRFEEVARLVRRSEFTLLRRSDFRADSSSLAGRKHGRSNAAETVPNDEKFFFDVVLLDTIGELASLYDYATVVFVGGSLVPRGGHNVIEPAAFAKPIIVGPHTENFRQIIADFLDVDAIIQVKDSEGLREQIARLLVDSESAKVLGKRAQDLLFANRGATECTFELIRKAIND